MRSFEVSITYSLILPTEWAKRSDYFWRWGWSTGVQAEPVAVLFSTVTVLRVLFILLPAHLALETGSHDVALAGLGLNLLFRLICPPPVSGIKACVITPSSIKLFFLFCFKKKKNWNGCVIQYICLYGRKRITSPTHNFKPVLLLWFASILSPQAHELKHSPHLGVLGR